MTSPSGVRRGAHHTASVHGRAAQVLPCNGSATDCWRRAPQKGANKATQEIKEFAWSFLMSEIPKDP